MLAGALPRSGEQTVDMLSAARLALTYGLTSGARRAHRELLTVGTSTLSVAKGYLVRNAFRLDVTKRVSV
jgi:hypothetical protein